MPGHGVHFRVWAPEHKSVDVVFPAGSPSFHPLDRETYTGCFSGMVANANAGDLYKYRLDGADWYPDPASRFQPEGPHHYSRIVDPAAYSWRDADWKGVGIQGQVMYEMHIGTFTQEGTWTAAIPHLRDLAETGITVLEVMPVHEFPGNFGWGYDGVHPFAPTRLYGQPDDFRRFVDEAHALRMGVILDVVYNHLGPDGSYFAAFSPYYFTAKHQTDWGEAINFYDEHCGPVRELFISNAGYWIREFHLDGLRLDATQNIYDLSGDHILAAITREARKAGGQRSTLVIGENEPQDVKLIRPVSEGGYGMDALWNDDLHHSAMVRLTGHNEAYYNDYRGKPQEFISAVKYGYLYQGQWYRWQHQRRGTPAFGLPPAAFVTFAQNHDQVANSARGLRAHVLAAPGIHKAMTAFLLLAPGTPMIFQGEEFASSSPFLYFADHKPEISRLVKEGRRKFLGQFRSLAARDMWGCFADPHDPATFERSKLDQSERKSHPETSALFRDLLRLRREDPVFQQQIDGAVDGAVLSPDAFVLRYFGERDDRLVIVNFGLDLHLDPAPEPLLAPPEDMEWDVIWSSEAPQYGGRGVPEADTVENWYVPGQAAIVLKPAQRARTAKEPKPSQHD
ncbi:MAG: malto-oligosyltrehalose trehalohydrolase [Bryobacteraceae bacterium]